MKRNNNKNKGKFFIGKVKDFNEQGGWFMGHFVKKEKFPLLKTSRVEVAWKKGKFVGPQSKRHFHKKAIEIDIVISGWIKVEIQGKEYKVKKGEFYLIYPGVVTKDLKIGKNTQMIIIKVPSVPEDKFLVK